MAIIILLAFFILAWVVLIYPRQRELKRHQKLMTELHIGEEVMMTSGIYGFIREIDGDYVQLEIADGLQIKIAKRSVAARVEVPQPSDADDDADSVAAGPIGQTPVSEAGGDPREGDDGDGAVIDLDDEIDTRENEA